jgi:hypothetical protein
MSDSSDRNIVMILTFGVVLYMFYVKGNLKIKNDWLNVKCNPLKLFLTSINSDPVASVGTFSDCVNQFNKKALENSTF